jgi:membrane protein DedA with SNARE-associated domain
VHALTAFFLNMLHHAGYGGLFAAMAAANVGAPVGSELILPAAGALAARGYLPSVWIAIIVAIVAELVGQTAAYAIGRFGGRPFVERFGKYVHFRHKQLAVVEGFFVRYGRFAIFICRFIPVIRGVVGIAAGIAEMPLLPFYLWTLLGSTIFCAGLILAGSGLGHLH